MNRKKHCGIQYFREYIFSTELRTFSNFMKEAGKSKCKHSILQNELLFNEM